MAREKLRSRMNKLGIGRWGSLTSLLLAGAFCVSHAQASTTTCVSGVFWPSGAQPIPLNPVLVISTCGESLEELGAYLRDEAGEIIQLRKRRTLTNSIELLEPELPLRALAVYELRWESRPEDDWPRIFTTSAETDHEAPKWRAPPRLGSERSAAQRGLRPHFEIAIGEALAGVLPILGLKQLEGSEKVLTRGIQTIEDGEGAWLVLDGGDGWSSGPMRAGESYEATISFLDLAGNQSAERRVRFRTPEPFPPVKCETATTLDGGVAHTRVEPECTELAIRARVQGTVEGKLEVGRDGSVRRVSISKPLPMGLDEATRKALGDWSFEPAEIELRQIFFETRFSLSQQRHEPVWRELP